MFIDFSTCTARYDELFPHKSNLIRYIKWDHHVTHDYFNETRGPEHTLRTFWQLITYHLNLWIRYNFFLLNTEQGISKPENLLKFEPNKTILQANISEPQKFEITKKIRLVVSTIEIFIGLKYFSPPYLYTFVYLSMWSTRYC